MPEPLSTERLTEIERTVPRGYPAPWSVEPKFDGDDSGDVLRGWLIGYDRSHVAPGLHDLCGLVATVPDYGEGLAGFIASARTVVPELMAEVRRLAGLLALALEHLEACPAPDIAHGWDLCPHGEKWPCKATKAAWQLRGLDEQAQITAAVEAAQAVWAREAEVSS